MSAFGSIPESCSAVLAPLVALIEKSVRGMDQKLGYRGKDRFVLFYYEPRGEEVIWQDRPSSGFSTGFGQCFIDELSPVAEVHKVDLGNSGTPGPQVLLIDRTERQAYFVERDEAIRCLSSMAWKQPEDDSGTRGEI